MSVEELAGGGNYEGPRRPNAFVFEPRHPRQPMTAADELRTAAASIRAGDMPADPEKFLAAVAELLDMHAQGIEDFNSRERFGNKGAPYPEVQPNANFAAVARAWNADLP